MMLLGRAFCWEGVIGLTLFVLRARYNTFIFIVLYYHIESSILFNVLFCVLLDLAKLQNQPTRELISTRKYMTQVQQQRPESPMVLLT